MAYELDCLIPPGLGGTDSVGKLWPQPYNAAPWNAYAKDALEDRLLKMVCSDEIPLSTAQSAVARDWVIAYQKYFRT